LRFHNTARQHAALIITL